MIERYANRPGEARRAAVETFDPDLPVAGCYRVRLRKGGPPVGLRIWHGFALDPATGAEMTERSPQWQCAINDGERVDVFQWWPGCARDPISQAEHDRIAAESRTMDEESAFFDPRRPVDRLTARLPF